MEQFECISVQQAQSQLADNKALLVDIRDRQSYDAAHASGAIHLTNETLAPLLEQADLSLPVLVMCYHGISSKSAAQYLLSKGFEQACSIDGGFEAWQATFPQQVESSARQTAAF